VDELVSQGLMKRSDLKTERTILKLTFRGLAMIQTYLTVNKAWYWRIHPIFGVFFLAIGTLALISILPTNGDLLASIFYAVTSFTMGALYLTIWWWYTVVGRKQFLKLEKEQAP
jgi:hypothetical protein